MKRSKSRRGVRRVRVSADGVGVVSHAGLGMLREVAELTGLIGNVTEVLAVAVRPWGQDSRRFTLGPVHGCVGSGTGAVAWFWR